MNNCYVYILIDPINRLPFYVGKGVGSRMYAHELGHANYNKRKLNTISAIKMLGHQIIYYKAEEGLSSNDALKEEQKWIKMLRNVPTLTNDTKNPPDRTGHKLSEEHKQTLREFNVGKTLTKDHKIKIGKSNMHVPNYNQIGNPQRIPTHNVGGRNPRAIAIEVNGLSFECKRDALEYFGVSKPTFEKRYEYVLKQNKDDWKSQS